MACGVLQLRVGQMAEKEQRQAHEVALEGAHQEAAQASSVATASTIKITNEKVPRHHFCCTMCPCHAAGGKKVCLLVYNYVSCVLLCVFNSQTPHAGAAYSVLSTAVHRIQ